MVYVTYIGVNVHTQKGQKENNKIIKQENFHSYIYIYIYIYIYRMNSPM